MIQWENNVIAITFISSCLQGQKKLEKKEEMQTEIYWSVTIVDCDFVLAVGKFSAICPCWHLMFPAHTDPSLDSKTDSNKMVPAYTNLSLVLWLVSAFVSSEPVLKLLISEGANY